MVLATLIACYAVNGLIPGQMLIDIYAEKLKGVYLSQKDIIIINEY